MADERPTQFPLLSGANLALTDRLIGVDVSDTTDNAAGSDMGITFAELIIALQLKGALPKIARGTETETNSSNTTWVDVTGVSWDVVSGRRYWVKVAGIYQTVITTTGMQIQFAGPTLTANTSPTVYRARQGGNGTDSFFESGQVASLTPATSTAVAVNATDAPFFYEGVLEPSSTATLQLQFRSELNTSQAQIRAGVIGMLFDITGT